MDPKEFDWQESQQVTVTNPTDEAYTFKVHGNSYSVSAGQTVKMPGFVAWVYVYGLSVRIAQSTNVVEDKNGNKTSDFQHWNEEGFRKQYFDKLVVEREPVMQVIEEAPQITEVKTQNRQQKVATQ